MLKKTIAAAGVVVALLALAVYVLGYASRGATAAVETEFSQPETETLAPDNGFSVEVLVEGRPAAEYAARGRRYIEALENAEYELRIHNPTGARVAVALSVDGLNTIDARHTSAWDGRKWVIEPYGSISVRGWQMSADNARRFFFTSERDSYAAKLGQAANLGVITAVFFRERRPITIMPVTPGETRPYPKEESKRAPQNSPSTSSAGDGGRDSAMRSTPGYPPPDDESAATGIGRSVANGVRWIKMDLEPSPAGEVTIRYEYRAALVRLGIIPRDYSRPEVLDRRERAQGFEPKYCPQPQ
jgi:hypothetical protein